MRQWTRVRFQTGNEKIRETSLSFSGKDEVQGNYGKRKPESDMELSDFATFLVTGYSLSKTYRGSTGDCPGGGFYY